MEHALVGNHTGSIVIALLPAPQGILPPQAAAAGATCVVSSDGRPLGGIIIHNPSLILNLHPVSLRNVLLHEALHVLGFVGPTLSAHGLTSSDETKVVAPGVVAHVRSHYGCHQADGLELEAEGSAGTASSHWESRRVGSEAIMAPQLQASTSSPLWPKVSDVQPPPERSAPGVPVLTQFTLALLGDLPWYRSHPENLPRASLSFGSALGCSFLESSCWEPHTCPSVCAPSGTAPGTCPESPSPLTDSCHMPQGQAPSFCPPATRCLERTEPSQAVTGSCLPVRCGQTRGATMYVAVSTPRSPFPHIHLQCPTTGSPASPTSLRLPGGDGHLACPHPSSAASYCSDPSLHQPDAWPTLLSVTGPSPRLSSTGSSLLTLTGALFNASLSVFLSFTPPASTSSLLESAGISSFIVPCQNIRVTSNTSATCTLPNLNSRLVTDALLDVQISVAAVPINADASVAGPMLSSALDIEYSPGSPLEAVRESVLETFGATGPGSPAMIGLYLAGVLVLAFMLWSVFLVCVKDHRSARPPAYAPASFGTKLVHEHSVVGIYVCYPSDPFAPITRAVSLVLATNVVLLYSHLTHAVFESHAGTGSLLVLVCLLGVPLGEVMNGALAWLVRVQPHRGARMLLAAVADVVAAILAATLLVLNVVLLAVPILVSRDRLDPRSQNVMVSTLCVILADLGVCEPLLVAIKYWIWGETRVYVGFPQTSSSVAPKPFVPRHRPTTSDRTATDLAPSDESVDV